MQNQTFADPGIYMNAYDDIVSKALNKKVKAVSGNYYNHSLPYYPHTDYNSKFNNVVNAVIPLTLPVTDVGLVIFDQRWEGDSALWTMSYSKETVSKFVGNTVNLKEGRPYDFNITNKTNKDIDNDFYQKYLKHFKKEDLFGLSGTYEKYDIGDIIIFDNKKIHCTSYYEGEKLGLSLRYEIVGENYG